MKKLSKIICTLIATSVLLTACSSSTKVEVRPQNNSVPVSVSWWGNDPRHEYMINGLEDFQSQHPSIMISTLYAVWNGYESRYQMLMRSHSNADVMQINYAWLNKYSADGLGYYDLSTLSSQIDFSNFSLSDIATGTVNGHLNALPTAYNTSCFFYNENIFNNYSLSIPSTWEDLFDAASVMSSDGMYPLGMIYKHAFLVLNAWFEQTTGRVLFDIDGTYVGTYEDIYSILEFYGQLIDSKVLMPPADFEVTYFGAGAIAGVSCWASDSGRYCNELVEAGIPVIVGDFLQLESGNNRGWYIKPATMFAISATCENPAEAGMVLNYLLNDPDFIILQGTERGIPVSATAVKTLTDNGLLTGVEYEAGQIIRNNIDTMTLINPMLESSSVQDAFKSISDMYIYGEISLDDAASMLHEKFSK